MNVVQQWARPARLGALYAPPRSPVIVDVPPIAYLTRTGRGAPEESLAWAEAVDGLRSAWDALHRRALGHPGQDGADGPRALPPLEVLWAGADTESWTVLLAVDDDIDPTVECPGAEIQRLGEGWCAQLLHVGGRRERAVALARLDRFVARQGYHCGAGLHEILLDEAAAVAEPLRRSILRRRVATGD